MSGEKDSGQDKTEDPTPKRRKDFREKGKVAQSRDLASVGVLFAVGLATAAWWPFMVGSAEGLTLEFIGDGPANVEIFLKDPIDLLMLGMWKVLVIAGPILAVAVVAGLLIAIAQVGLMWSWKPLEPDLNKLNPITGIQQKIFSAQAMFEWVKAMAKVTVVGVVGYKLAVRYGAGLTELASASLRESVGWTGGIVARLLFFTLLVMLALAIGDYAFAKWQLLRKMRMTKQELKEEHKEMEGDPHMKAKVRRLMVEMSSNRLVAEVSDATVVVANPSHYAIAIRYEMGQAGPPIVVARGKDERAQKIKEIARSNGVPRIENRPLARALYASVKEGQEIPAGMYEAVAEVLAFVYRLRNRHKPQAAPAAPPELAPLY